MKDLNPSIQPLINNSQAGTPFLSKSKIGEKKLILKESSITPTILT